MEVKNRIALAVALSAMPGGMAQQPGAEAQTQALAKATQNPVASLISVPIQSNTNFPIGPFGRVQNVLNIQPVIPMALNADWNLITRVIVPVAYQPDISSPNLGTSGFGDVNPSFFFAPSKGKLIWGVGPTFVLNTATNHALGSGKWSAGPTVVVLVQPGKWTLGALTNNVWSFAGIKGDPNVNAFLLQYFINYNLNKGWYIGTSPIITANWVASADNKWVVPVGAAAGRILRLGKQPVNIQAGMFYNIVQPEQIPYPRWSARIQIAFLFPKGQ
jgi:hypothetical protein